MGRKWANIVAKKTAKDGATSKVYAIKVSAISRKKSIRRCLFLPINFYSLSIKLYPPSLLVPTKELE